MSFNEYREEIKRLFFKDLTSDSMNDAKRYFETDEAQGMIKEYYDYYSSTEKMLKGASRPESVASCLLLMWH